MFFLFKYMKNRNYVNTFLLGARQSFLKNCTSPDLIKSINIRN